MNILDSGMNIIDKPDFEVKADCVLEDLNNLNDNIGYDRYKLLSTKPFAVGGQASIFNISDADHPEMSLCLKVININHVLCQENSETPEKVLKRYKLEIKNLKDLNECINVVKLYRCFASADMYDEKDSEIKYNPDGRGYMYLIMEKLTPLNNYIESLKNRLKNDPNRDQRLLSLFKKITIDICLALAECEKNHILHRDIKLDNILVRETANGDPDFVLADFGISRMDVEGQVVTQMGTYSHTAPEIAYGLPLHGYNADIYSLGNSVRDLLKHLNNPADCQGYDIFDKVIDRAEDANPQTRYQDANEMLEDLKEKFSYEYAKKLFCDSKRNEALEVAYKALNSSKNDEEKTNCRRLIAIIKHNKAYNPNYFEIEDRALFDEALDEMFALAYKGDMKASYFYFIYWNQTINRMRRTTYVEKLKPNLKFLIAPAEDGFAPAQFEYGKRLYEGRVIDKNEELGFNYIMRAVRQDFFVAKRYMVDHIAGKSEKILIDEETLRIIKDDIKDEKTQKTKDIIKFI